MALKYIHFMEDELKQCVIKDGVLSIGDFLKKNFADDSNFLRHTTREIGRLKGQRHELVCNMNFTAPTALNAYEERAKTKYWNNIEAQRVLSTILELAQTSYVAIGNDINPFIAEDVLEAYNDKFKSLCITCTKTAAKKYLKEFSDQGMIQKKGKEAGSGGSTQEYLVMHQLHLQRFINSALLSPSSDNEDGVLEATIVEEGKFTEVSNESA